MIRNSPQQHGVNRLSLSYEELRDLQDCLRRPLSNRPVLIPLGPQALISGRLQPRRCSLERIEKTAGSHNDKVEESSFIETETATTSSSNTHGDDEIVSLSLSTDRGESEVSCLKEMTRKEAMAYFQSEMDLLIKKKGPKPKVAQQPTTTNASLELPPTTALPLFDIREELNDSGQEVKSEAIEVTQLLELMEREASQSNAGDHMNPKFTNSQNPINDINNSTEAALVEEETLYSEKQMISDQEYQSLLSRLDELALLEQEEEERERQLVEKEKAGGIRAKINKQNSNKPQPQPKMATGWAKGFLNTTNNKKKQTPPPPTKIKSISTKSTAESLANSEKRKSSQPENFTSIQKNSSLGESSQSTNQKSVSFSDQTQIQEIPRIGQQTVPRRGGGGGGIVEEDALFCGVVQERPKKSRNNNKNPSSANPSPTASKPLSRFAQQRQELE